jgi:hypothetical protein
MSKEIEFIPYELAKKIVGAVMEEEHLHEPGRRILTVYDIRENELCWFDADDIMMEVAQQEGGVPKKQDDLKAAAVELIMHKIPEWAVQEALKAQEKK